MNARLLKVVIAISLIVLRLANTWKLVHDEYFSFQNENQLKKEIMLAFVKKNKSCLIELRFYGVTC